MKTAFNCITYNASFFSTYRLNILSQQLKPFLETPANYYPNFDRWYSKISLELATGKREIITIELKGNICGFSIIKNTHIENKICTLLVLKKYRRYRLAESLMRASLDRFSKNADVTLSIGDMYIDYFLPLMQKFMFTDIKQILGYYRKKSSEHFFIKNAIMTEKKAEAIAVYQTL